MARFRTPSAASAGNVMPSGCLDTPWAALYKTRVFWLIGLLAFAPVAQAEVVQGVQLPDGARKVGENRYRAAEGWEDVLKYYRTVFPVGSYPRKPIVNQPGIKAVHIVNPSGKQWEGINIYEANEEVRIFIVVAPEPPKRAPVKKKPARRSR